MEMGALPTGWSGTVDELGEVDRGYGYAMERLIVPALQKFEPDMIVQVHLIPMEARQCLTMEGYREIGRAVRPKRHWNNAVPLGHSEKKA
nr:histone deacetylase 8 [Ipomoea batatas]GMC68187.1 histone deacetylase 8 [Ipomoea batatas]